MKLYYTLLLFFLLFIFSCQNRQTSELDSKKTDTTNINYLTANKLLQENKLDSSFIYFDLASDEFLAKGDSLNAATCLIQMAVTLYMEGDFYGSQETSIEADRLINKENPSHAALLAYNYNNIGNAISGYGDHLKAIPYYDLAIQYSYDSVTALSYENNKAVTLSYINNYKEASEIFKKILQSNISSQAEYARALSNYANSHWRVDLNYNPLQDLRKALAIRQKENDLYGVNASYAHLYYYFKDRNQDSALYYARKSYALASQLNNTKDIINASEKLVQLTQSDSSQHYFKIYKELSDSVRIARLKASNQYAMIRYEAEKSKMLNLQLEKDVLDKDLHLAQQRMILVVVVISTSLGIVFFVYRYNKRKKELQLEADNRIKENKLKTSKKVHDVVANGIYRVMSELENIEDLDREDLLDKLEIMYEKSRDISYETEEKDLEKPFSKEISYLLKSFAHENLKLFIVGNEEELWKKISPQNRKELLPVIQELLVNMRKHSEANELIFKVEELGVALGIHYIDNGIGFPAEIKKGNGLMNTGNRMEKIGGAINFDLTREKGAHIIITVPFE